MANRKSTDHIQERFEFGAEAQVCRLCLDIGVHIDIDDENSELSEADIYTEFSIEIDDSIRNYSPRLLSGKDMQEVHKLLWKPVRSVVITSVGTLVVDLRDALVSIPSHAEWEAWKFTRADGAYYVCLPGGDVTSNIY